MSIGSLPGSVTAPDPLEVENDALRAEVERLKEDRAALLSREVGFVVAMEATVKALALGDSDAYALHPDTADRLNGVRCGLQNALHGKGATVATLTAERDAARVEIRDATEALDEWRPGSRESLAAAVTRLRQALQAADIDLEELFAARKAMSPGGMQRRELPALVTALRAERESILAVVRDYASLMLSHDAVALVDRLRAVLKAGDKP